ncbi:MAG: PD40 domain-containing protein [Sedimentisphaerales bacterium]|nr:PD40 domain-containing protein [Sedimentisphaerales bacterium]
MDRINRHSLIVLVAVALLAGSVCVMAFRPPAALNDAPAAGRAAKIHPDCSNAVIPPNIAPLDFQIQEEASRYFVRIGSATGRPIEIASRSGRVTIPRKAWCELLAGNRGQRLSFDIFAQQAGGEWQRFDSVHCTVAKEDIDPYLVYRRIHPVHAAHREMGVYQRDLTGFKESTVLTGGYFHGGCVNCHTFCNNRTDRMLISTRTARYTSAAILVDHGEARKVGSTFGYASWHPSGKILTYSMNKVVLFHHTVSDESRDVMDLDSLIAYYVVGPQTVKTAPDLSRKDRLETYPTWSPDGRFLYFCSAPLTWTDRTAIPEGYQEVRYDLMRIGYDADKDQWGTLETVLSAKETGKTILLPRVSPDGRWLLFCMCDYGCFPVYQSSSDLYMIDLEAAKETGRYEYRRLDISSDQSESWHSWSSNSRWIAFSSKRGSGVFTRTYLSYVDANGIAHPPLVLPQKDPTHYDTCLWAYNVPELAAEAVHVTKESLGRVVRSPDKIAVQIPVTTATPKAGAAPEPYISTRE